jgi:hypothetical protein
MRRNRRGLTTARPWEAEMMRPDVTELLEQLARHFRLYQELAELLAREQENLIHFNLDRLAETARSKGMIVERIRQSVLRVAENIRTVAARLGLAGEPLPTLARLAEALEEPASGRLRRAGQRLARLKNDTFRHNHDNQGYVQEALGLVEDCLSVVKDAVQPASGRYLPTGLVAAGASQALKLNRNV